eukprot:scaffold90161_cov73-Cyclotella_meneghiniana.AAC.3
MNTTTSSSPSPDKPASKSSTAVKDSIAGALAGSLAKTAVAPIERVKLLMQLQFSLHRVNAGLEERVPSRTSAWDVAKRVYREEGLLSFWRGENIIIPTAVTRDVVVIRQFIPSLLTFHFTRNHK